MELQIDISQKQVLSQHMIQSMEILQMTAQELESYIENLALENPVIDLPEISLSDSRDNFQQEDIQRKIEWFESTDWQNRIYYQQDRSAEDIQGNWHDDSAYRESLSDYLLSQILLSDYTASQRTIIEFMIRSLNPNGYFQEDTADLAGQFGVPEKEILKLLSDIQDLDPAGVGARGLKECLLLQLKRKKDCSAVAKVLINDYLEDIAKNHFHIIAQKLGVSLEEIKNACDEIQSLNPKPGNSFSACEQLRYIRPDVLVVRLDTGFEIVVNEYQFHSFTINSYYQELSEQTADKETKKYLNEKISQAMWVSGCIRQRKSTISRVMKALVEKQQDFFLYGLGNKRPLKLADLAEELGLHESTVSRAMRGKYLQCSWGIFPLNYFLTSVATKSADGLQEKTPEQLKALIQKTVDEEDKRKPLSDQAISDKLKEMNITLSRRTVNKYRGEMGIPDKSGRKQ